MNEWMKYWDLPTTEMKKTNKSIMLLWVDAPLLAFSMKSQVTMQNAEKDSNFQDASSSPHPPLPWTQRKNLKETEVSAVLCEESWGWKILLCYYFGDPKVPPAGSLGSTSYIYSDK